MSSFYDLHKMSKCIQNELCFYLDHVCVYVCECVFYPSMYVLCVLYSHTLNLLARFWFGPVKFKPQELQRRHSS